jgi:hypothetical protein
VQSTDAGKHPVTHSEFRHPAKGATSMCRNIKTLFNFEPPATELEIHDASLQFVRKLSGFNAPSQANKAAFERAVADVTASAQRLMESLVTNAEPKNRDTEAIKARERSALSFGSGHQGNQCVPGPDAPTKASLSAAWPT